MIPATYQHAIDSGVYLREVDSSYLGARTPIDASTIPPDAAVFLIIGQSNGANHGEVKHAARRHVYNFNPFDGLCYAASDPLLGATGDGGSPWCLLGNALIEANFAPAILLVPLCVGGATVAEWAPGGPYHHRLTYCLRKLDGAGFWPTHVLWHQGEADALFGTAGAAYVNSFRSLVGSLRDQRVAAPIFVARVSFSRGSEDSRATIRQAQESLLDPGAGIYRGPDTDAIRDRFDGCHMGKGGLEDHASAWTEILQNHRRARGQKPGRLPGQLEPNKGTLHRATTGRHAAGHERMLNWGKRIILQSLDSAGYRLLKRGEHERLLAIGPSSPEPALPAQASVSAQVPMRAFERGLIDGVLGAPGEYVRFLEELGAKCNLPPLRLLALYSAARYLTDIGIEGDVVDCGYGATATLVALATAFRQFGDTSRRLVLFDTTADPLHRPDTELELWGADRDLLSASNPSPRDKKPEPAPAEIIATGYPAENVSVRRYPREPIVSCGPAAFLGVTSETYDANRIAIATFFPLLCRKGVIAAEGDASHSARRDAVGEFFRREGIDLFLVQVARNYRIGVKV